MQTWRSATTPVAMLVALAAAGLAACTTSQSPQSSQSAGRLLVAQGKYRFYDCGQLATQAKVTEQRSRELTALIAKANQGPGGGLVSALSYEPDLAVARGELAEIRREQAEKKCSAAEPVRRIQTPQ